MNRTVHCTDKQFTYSIIIYCIIIILNLSTVWKKTVKVCLLKRKVCHTVLTNSLNILHQLVVNKKKPLCIESIYFSPCHQKLVPSIDGNYSLFAF